MPKIWVTRGDASFFLDIWRITAPDYELVADDDEIKLWAGKPYFKHGLWHGKKNDGAELCYAGREILRKLGITPRKPGSYIKLEVNNE